MMIAAKRSARASLGSMLMLLALGVAAQPYPTKPLRIIVPFPPGGATDLLGRYIGQKLGETLGQSSVIENRAGANGTIGVDVAAKAAPDGHTLVVGQTGNLAISPSLTRVPYDPLRDLAPVTLVAASPHVLAVHPSLPARSLKELIVLARSKPGQLNYASTGSGSAGHLGVELLKKTAKIDLVHVPYKGAVPALTDVLAGHVAIMFTSVLATQQVAKAGKVRMLAVGGSQRSPAVPDIPTVAESGFPGFEVVTWWGILGQAAMPKEIVTRLNSEIVRIMGTPDARERIGGAVGAEIVTSTPEQFASYLKAEHAKWGQLVKESGARVD